MHQVRRSSGSPSWRSRSFPSLHAQQADVAATLRAQIDRIFKDRAYDAPRFGPARWQPDGNGLRDRRAAAAGGTEIAALRRRDRSAIGPRHAPTLDVSDYAWSPDGQAASRLHQHEESLAADIRAATTTCSTWRRGTQKKLGAPAPESSLMFAKFSPDATRVAYVRQNNLYVEHIATGAVTQLTKDGTARLRHGYGAAVRCGVGAGDGRHDRQRHVGLGQRRGVGHPRRLPLESRRDAASRTGNSTPPASAT